MSIITFGCEPSRLRGLVGIRARLILLTMILVAPLMLDRMRVLEDNRTKQVALAGTELSGLAKRTAEAQRDVLLSVQAVLKSSAYIYSAASGADQGCGILRASKRPDLPWIRTLSVIDTDGKVVCSTTPSVIGLKVDDRDYFQRVMNTPGFVVSDYIFTRRSGRPAIMALYPAKNFASNQRVIIAATIDLGWMSKILADHAERAGVSALMTDGDGVILAAQPDQAALVGQKIKETSLLDAVAAKELNLDRDEGSIVYDAADGQKQIVNFARIDGTRARMIVSTNEARMLGDIDRSIRTAYAQFALVIFVALLGAWIVAERVIVRPVRTITDMAERFGAGDLTPQQSDPELPSEFVPLLNAFNRMAEQLSEREADLIATNSRLTVMASIDMVSGLANRRGFQSRFDFEWLKAKQSGADISLIMIDVDYFKLFNDTYGHPEGDVCLGTVGETLLLIAAQASGFAARYGGEEFCVLIPGANSASAHSIAETIRANVQKLAIPHDLSALEYVTVSAGVATMKPAETASAQDLVDAADAALYAAKRRGRNNVVSHALTRGHDRDLSMAS